MGHANSASTASDWDECKKKHGNATNVTAALKVLGLCIARTAPWKDHGSVPRSQ